MMSVLGRRLGIPLTVSGMLAVFLLSTTGPLGADGTKPAAYTIPDVAFVPTPQSVVTKMLEMARAGPDDILYDLGSGDGRIVITAARDFGVRKAIGVDIDPDMVRLGTANAEAAGVGDKTRFVQGNIFEHDFREATVITIYLLPTLNMRLRPTLLDKLRPGTRIVSHQFDMEDWIQDAFARYHEMDIYMWTVPARVHGTWEWQRGKDRYRLDLTQRFQQVSGTLSVSGRAAPITAAVLNGDRLRFEAKILRDGRNALLRFDGRFSEDVINGMAETGGKTERAMLKRAN